MSDQEELGDRRPLASRNTSWAHKATAALAKTNIQPNHISIGSMVFAAIAGVLFYISGQTTGGATAALLLLAALCCQFRLLCNLFDGMLAVEAGRRTADGLAWNEFPDRYADIFIFVGIGYGIGYPSLGWAAACFSVLTAYTRELGNAVGNGADFSGPMAKQHRMALVTLGSLVAAAPLFFNLSFDTTLGNSTQSILAVILFVVCIGAVATSIRRTSRLLSQLI